MDYGETACEVFQADETTKLLARIWLPESETKAIFIGIHGGMAHGGDWVTSAQYFKEKGVALYALDMRWHGAYPEFNKDGKNFFHIDSYDEYARDLHGFYGWVKERHPGIPIFIISHSNGALISLYYGLSIGKDSDIRGYILSSPWLENRVAVPKIVRSLSKLIAATFPRFSIVPEAVTGFLTHDEAITARHYSDEKSGIRGTRASAKLGVESEKTQKWVLDHMKHWKTFPIFCVIAGQDKLAVAETSEKAFEEPPAGLVKVVKHVDNYHENFNEVNRGETFNQVWDWVKTLTV
jgi:lysophospholipase